MTRASACAAAGRCDGAIPRVGVLYAGSPGSPALSAFVAGMASLGYHDGSSVKFDFKCANGRSQYLPRFAQKLAAEAPDVIVAIANEAIVEAARACETTPIVGTCGDLDFVALGLAKSLHDPGGNVTGMTINTGEAAQLRVAWLARVVPSLSKLAVLLHPANPANPRLLGMIREVATHRGIELLTMLVSRPEHLEAAVREAKLCGADAATTLQSPFFFFQRKALCKLCERLKLPVALGEPLSAEAGALLQVSPDVAGAARASAQHVHRVLRGCPTGELAIQRHPAIDILLNLRVARAFNFDLAPSAVGEVQVIE